MDPIRYVKRKANLGLNVFAEKMRTPWVPAYPSFYHVEPSAYCNFECPACPGILGNQSDRELVNGQMKLETFQKVVDQVADYAERMELFLRGEPFLNNRIYDMIRYAVDQDIYVKIDTNGSALRARAEDVVQSRLNLLVVSLDGVTAESYGIYRIGGNFDQVIEGVRKVVEERHRLKSNRPRISLQFIVMKHNEHELDRVLDFGRDLGVDEVRIKGAQIYTQDQAEAFLPTETTWRRYVMWSGTEPGYKPQDEEKGCGLLWHSVRIACDGSVRPCDRDIHGKHEFGNVMDGRSFWEIWNGEDAREFRRRHISENTDAMCKMCVDSKYKTTIIDLADLKPKTEFRLWSAPAERPVQ